MVVESWEPGVQPTSGYQLVRLLGKGGMGEVWQADGPGGMPVALKRVSLGGTCGDHELSALKLLKRVRHPHLLAVHGFWTFPHTLVIGFELADDSLASLIETRKESGQRGLSIAEAVSFLSDAAEALDYLARPVHRMNGHCVRIQHRDVKPANLLIQGGALKVADFGLAKALENVAQSHSISLTAAYAAPEFFRGQTTARSDQYSLGVTYYQLRTGKLPFSGSPHEIMDGHLHREPNLEGLSETEKQIVLRALAKNPDLRWAGCVKFIGELQRSEDAGVVISSQPPSPFDRVKSGQRDSEANAAKIETVDLPRPKQETLAYRGRPVTTGLLLVGEELVPIPLTRTEFRASVTAATAEVTVTQLFRNSLDRAVEATYVFPLPDDAAINRLQMRIEDRIIEGVVREKAEARQTYQEAKQAGHVAALLEQESPNIFTNSVANILPGQEIHVEITYLQPLPFDEGEFRLVLPMVVSPRYVPGTQEMSGSSVGDLPTATTTARIPQGMLRGDSVSVEIDLDAGVPLCGFDSPSHDIVTLDESGPSRVRVSLQQDDEIPNRDFVLNYSVTGPQIENALVFQPGTHDEGGTFLFFCTPPRVPEAPTGPRELVFVIDRSGSMDGQPLAHAKQAARQLIERLRPTDRFNLIAFDHTVQQFADHSIVADPSNVRRACGFLEDLDAGGGTEMLEPLRLALRSQGSDGAEPPRMVILLTDGSVDGEREMLTGLREKIGRSRIVGFGIGTAVNRHLINKLTQAGRGFSEYVYPGENIARIVDRTLGRLSEPVLTDVQLSWKGDEVEQVIPAQTPDLYRNRPLMVVGRFRGKSCPELTIKGQIGDQDYAATIQATNVRKSEGGVSLRALWARHQIENLMDQIWEHPDQQGPLRNQVITLAIEHRLASEYTSFLAVEYRSSAERDKAKDAVSVDIPQLTPDGMFANESPLQATKSARDPGVTLEGCVDFFDPAMLSLELGVDDPAVDSETQPRDAESDLGGQIQVPMESWRAAGHDEVERLGANRWPLLWLLILILLAAAIWFASDLLW